MSILPSHMGRKLIVPDAVKIQTLLMDRSNASSSFGPDDLLRATLAVIDLDITDLINQGGLIQSCFHPRESDRRDKFEHLRRKDSYTAGRLAAKLALKHHCPSADMQKISVVNGVFDQPVLVGDGPESDVAQLGVSISHSDGYAVALIFHRAHPMGVDIDLPAQQDIAPVLSGLDEQTQRNLANLGLSDIEGASLIWTARESLSKALTTGMMTPLALYRASDITRQGNSFVLHYENFAQYKTHVWPGKKGWLALTMPARTDMKTADPDWK